MPKNESGLPADFHSEPTISTKRIYEGSIINLRVDTVRMPSGNSATREIVEH
ncbi:MAG: ADP-ribose pyrophosphatase, partial [SAR202 cluster bacterium]|nr:ADP-ribose pyrophosphatase [SAR202 cluster bacterium]